MPLIVGIDDFGEVMKQQLHFVDKSLFIKKVFDNKNTQVSVITRPRRFGKTFNLSMLCYFLAFKVNGLITKGLFDNLKIAQLGDAYMNEQGKYPVIFLTLKSIKHTQYQEAMEGFSQLISQLYGQHIELLSNSVLHAHEKVVFERILNKKANSIELSFSLVWLCEYLYRYHQVKPWVLIDEYDTPIQSGYLHGYYDKLIDFMRGFFGNTLKGNPYLHRAVVTGILRIAKEGLFSGLNNVDVFSVLNEEYGDCFGFTEEEVSTLLEEFELQHLSNDIRSWYNGYYIGDTQIYNPWSIANCVNKEGLMKPYWVNTSDNALIKQLLAQASALIKEQFEHILQGRSIEVLIDENLIFTDLNKNQSALWSLLLFSGYLTAVETRLRDAEWICRLSSPNQEISALYRSIVRGWFTEPFGEEMYQRCLRSLVEGDLDSFLFLLKKFLFEAASFFDVKGNEPEKFYHGFIMGLMIGLSDNYVVQSNRESGYGRYDLLLIPKDSKGLGLILEFKIANTEMALHETAEKALMQINERRYAVDLQKKGIQKILAIGLAFYGKEVAMMSSWLENE